jgi:hypothetical protein
VIIEEKGGRECFDNEGGRCDDDEEGGRECYDSDEDVRRERDGNVEK